VKRPLHWLLLTAACAGIVTYSQQAASIYGDESLHLLIAKLVADGRRLYSDLFYQHPPLIPHLQAVVGQLFGHRWQVMHLLSALFTCAAVLLLPRVAASALPESDARPTLAVAAGLFFALDPSVLRYGVVGQAFGLCLFCAVAAVYCLLRFAGSPGWSSFLAGATSGAAVSAHLLSVPLPLVLAAWAIGRTPRARRVSVAAAFCLGLVAVVLPLTLPVWRSPVEARFDLVQFHLDWRHRGVWDELNLWRHNMNVAFRLFGSAPATLLLVLAAIGLVARPAALGRPRLLGSTLPALALAAAATALGLLVRPTFPQYFLLALPFLSVLAAIGLHVLVARFDRRQRAILLVVVFALYVATSARLVGSAIRARVVDASYWATLEEGAHVLRERGAGGRVYAAEPFVYLWAGLAPVRGLENFSAHQVRLEEGHPLAGRLVSEDELDRRFAGGYFDAVFLEVGEEPCGGSSTKSAYERVWQAEGYEVCALAASRPRTAP
jgi:hypothetical protein